MAYSFKQRADKGFDFFNDKGQKVFIDEYVKNTGANKNQLVQRLASAGDTVSKQAVSKLPAQFNAAAQPQFSVQALNNRQAADQIQARAKADVFNPAKIISDIGKGASDLGRGLVSGLQQGAGVLGDVATQAGSVVANPIAKILNPDVAKYVDQATVDYTDPLRRNIQNLKDVSGNKIVGTSNVDKNAMNIATGRGTPQDFAAVAGKGLEAGIAATTLANPVSLARGTTGQMTGRQLANFAGKDALFYGGTQGVATGAQTYGTTGDIGQALTEGAKAAALTGITQGALDTLGMAVRTAPKAVAQGAQVVKESTPRYQAARDPRVLGYDDQYKLLQQQFDTLPAGSQARRQVSQAMADNRAQRLNTSKTVERQISQRGSIQVPGGKPDYRSTHQIDSTTARNLGDMQSVDDVVSQIKSKYGLTNYDQKDITNLKKIVGNPDADVKIYRASPVNEINSGDWVTTSKEYANDIKRQNGGKVYEYTVKAKDLNLPANIEDNPSLARFSAFQYSQAPQVTKTYKTVNQGGKTVDVQGEPIKIADGIDTFIHQDENGNWVVSEVTSGRNLTGGGYENKNFAIKAARDTVFGNGVENVKKRIAEVATPTSKTPKQEPVQSQQIETAMPTAESRLMLPEKAATPVADSSIRIPKDGDSLDNIIAQTETLQLSKGQAKQRFKKLQREGTPFEIVNDLDKNAKAKGTNIVGKDGTVTQGGAAPLPDINLNQFRDRSALGLGRETMERNLDRVAGKDAPALKKYLVDASRKNETDRTLFVNDERAAVKQNIVKDLGIKPNSKESALVQQYGEKLIDEGDLVREVGEVQAGKIIQASDFFRNRYDDLIDRWNAVRQQYGYEAIPKRADYFRHFQAIENANSILGTVKNAKDLPTGISGITDIFNPSKPFSDAALARKGNKTTFDAVSGFDNYLDSISRQVYHTDTVQRGRALEKAIRGAADAETLKVELPNFVANLGEWTNLVSGKKARIDRAAEAMFGRKIFAGANAVKRRVGANMIGANLASAATSFIPMTQALATTSKPSAIKGLINTLSTVWTGPASKIDGMTSGFLTRRFPTQAMSRTTTDRLIKGSYLPMQALDGFNARTIVSSKYFENIKKGMSKTEAMKNADEYAGKVITDRSLGQQANLFEAKTPGFFTQFMTEVNNQASFVLRDVPQLSGRNPLKVASALTQMAVYAYMFNEAFEAATGRRVAVDPIDFIQTMVDPEKTDEQKWEAFQQDILSAIPGSGFIFDSGRLPINAALPDVNALVSAGKSLAEGDTEQAINQAAKGISGPAAFLLPPTGGGQTKKMTDAAFNQAKGYSETPSGEVRFLAPTEPLDVAKSFVFGQYATDKGQEYIDNGFDRLSEKQSDTLKALPKDQRQSYIDLKKGKSETSPSQAVAELTKSKEEKQAKFEASFSPQDYELYSLSKDDRTSLIDNGTVAKEKFDQLDAYANRKKSEFGLKVTSDALSKSKLNKGSKSYKLLDNSSELTTEEAKAWSKEKVSPEYRTLVDNVNSAVPKGLPKVPETNEVAKLYAEFEKNKADSNWSELQNKRESKKVLVEAYKTQLTDNEKFIGTLSDNDIVTAYENGEVSKDEIKRLLVLDETLVKLGMSATIGNKARNKLGYGSISSGSGSGKAKKFTMPETSKAFTQTQSTLKNLQSLLAGTSQAPARKKIGSGKVALREIKVKGA